MVSIYVFWSWFLQFGLDFYGLVLISKDCSGFLHIDLLIFSDWPWCLWFCLGFYGSLWFLRIHVNFNPFVVILMFLSKTLEAVLDLYSLGLISMSSPGFLCDFLISKNCSRFLHVIEIRKTLIKENVLNSMSIYKIKGIFYKITGNKKGREMHRIIAI